MNRRRLTLSIALLAWSLPAHAAPPGFAFLEVPVNARAAALGGAYASVARGAEAAFWNPAGLEDAHGTEISAAHAEFLSNLRHDQVAFAGRMFGGGIAASLRAMYSEPIDERDDLGNLIGTFGSNDLELALGYGASLAPGATAGASVAYVRERIANLATDTWSLGLGTAWQPASWPRLRLAAAVQNLGPSAHFTIDGTDGRPLGLPASLQAGGTWRMAVGSGLDLGSSLETRVTRGRQALLLVGEELATPVGAALRLGLRGGDDLSPLSFGVGYGHEALRFDYAFLPSRMGLEDTHRLSLATRF